MFSLLYFLFNTSCSTLLTKGTDNSWCWFAHTHLQCTTIGPCLAVWWDPTTARIRRRNSRTELENGQVWLAHSV